MEEGIALHRESDVVVVCSLDSDAQFDTGEREFGKWYRSSIDVDSVESTTDRVFIFCLFAFDYLQ